MNLIIQADTLDDLGFQYLREMCGLPLLDRALLSTALKGSLFTLSAFLDRELAGMVRVVGDGSFIFLIYDLLVSPWNRNLGIGGALVENAIKRIKTYLPKDMWVTINLNAAAGKEGFYTRFGFEALPNRHFGPGMQLITKATGPEENG